MRPKRIWRSFVPILVYLGVSDGKMEEGHLRAEPNLSIRPIGTTSVGVKTEIKNLNSFKSVYKGSPLRGSSGSRRC